MGERVLTVRLRANFGDLRAGFAAASQETKTFMSDIGGAAASTTVHTEKLARGMLIAGGVIGGALALATKGAIEFEQEMRNVTTISSYVDKNFEAVSNRLISMSNNLPQSAAELARGLYDVASSGFAGAEGQKVLKVAATAASAGLSDTATSARAITGALNAYGMEASNARMVSDVLFQTVNLGVITFEELAQNLGDVVGLAAQLKVPIKDVGAAIATITLAGIPAAEATTSLNRVMLSFLQPSDAMISQLHALGYESGEQALKQDGLKTVMLKLREATGGNVTAFQALFPEVRGLKGALALTAAEGENYNRVTRGMDDASKGAGASQKAFEQQAKSLGVQLEIMKNRIVNTGIAFASQLLPVLKVVAGAISDLFEGFTKAPGWVKTTTVALAALSSALLLVGGGILMVTSRIGAMRAQLLGMGPAGVRAAAGMTMLGQSIALASGAALAAYGFTQIGDSVTGTVVGVLSLVSAVGLLRQGLPAVSGLLANLSQRLTSGGFANAGVAVGGLAGSVTKLGAALPGIVATGAVAAASFDQIGKSSVGTAVGVASLAATGAQIGFVFGQGFGAVVGGAAGAVIGLARAMDQGGESADEYRKRISGLAGAIEGMSALQAMREFQGKLGDFLQKPLSKIKSELRDIATINPTGALKILQGLQTAPNTDLRLKLTRKEWDSLAAAIDKGSDAYAKNSLRAEQNRSQNDAIRQAKLELAGATGVLSEAEQKAAEEFAKTSAKMAQDASSNFLTVGSAFESATKAAQDLGFELGPEGFLKEMNDSIAANISFASNLQTLVDSGFTAIALEVSKRGPVEGGKMAQQLADGVKSGDVLSLALVGQTNEAAFALGRSSAVWEQQVRDNIAPAVQRGFSFAASLIDPILRDAIGIKAPAAVAQEAPSLINAYNVVGLLASGQFSTALGAVPATAGFAITDATGAVTAGGAELVNALASSGIWGAAQFGTGLAPMPQTAATAVTDAAGNVQAGAGAMGTSGTGAGEAGTEGVKTGLSGAPGEAGSAMEATAAQLLATGLTLTPQAAMVGVTIGTALVGGLTAAISSGDVSGAVSTLVGKVKSQTETKLGIESPSKVFAHYGRMVVAGFVGGIESESARSEMAVGALVGSGAMRGAGSVVSGGGGASSITVNMPVGGNIYGDQAFKSGVRSTLNEAARKSANDLRRKRS